MPGLNEIINAIYPIPENSFQKLERISSLLNFPKGFLLFQTNRIEHYIYFIKKGFARAYSYHNENEITFSFEWEGSSLFSIQNYIFNKPSYENIELLEDSILYRIKIKDIKDLYEQDIHLANWGRVFSEKEFLKAEENLISRQFKTSLERYKELLHKNPTLIQRTQLGHIASYLGVTQVTLSRIRSQLKFE